MKPNEAWRRGPLNGSVANFVIRGNYARVIEAIRTIKHGHVHSKQPGVIAEIRFVENLFGLAA